MPQELPEILNSKGQPIVLNDHELYQAEKCQREIFNSLGYEIPITTLTGISKRISEQKFFTVPPADYMPVRVGENAWTSQILTYRDYSVGGPFEDGVINTAESDSRLSEVGAGIDSVSVPVINWGKIARWTVPQLEEAARAGNWDIVASKERARKKNWDLGIQEVSFLGLNGNTAVKGLLTQNNVNSNTDILNGYIKDLDSTDFQAFVADIMGVYRINCNFTAYPTHFIIPETDYNGLASAVDEKFNLKSRLLRLQEVFKELTNNANFKIKPLAYANQANNASRGLNLNRYTLLNYDEDSVRMDIPVDYTNTMQNTTNGFQFENVGYGQFTGVQTYRELEMLYLDWNT